MISRQLIVTALGLLLVTLAYVGTVLSSALATSYGGYCVAVGTRRRLLERIHDQT